MLRIAHAYALGCLGLVGCSSASSTAPDAPSGGNRSVAQAGAAQAGAAQAGSSAAGAPNLGGTAGYGIAGADGGSSSVSAGAAGAHTISSGGTSGAGVGGGGTSGASGASSCDTAAPPSNVSAWVDESWNAQLGNNVKTRKAWNLDNVMLNQGKLSLCVRWGATSAVPATVRMNLESTIARWFNDWFKSLGSYDCFPYAQGIQVNVTGWAIKPGQQALLSGIDPAISVYTETDADGEPKCPDACSSFVHWDHVFTGCAGGAAKHSDYWLWFDDTLPGGGGAAAVGGDWGLRMPVSTFTDHFQDVSFLIAEHEMGHGFGFQDYYDWTGSRPTGGSLMIVGSTGSQQSPTVGDTWLLRRTWKEMKTLRSW